LTAKVPAEPKIYHILHVDRLPSIMADGRLWSDAEARRRGSPGTTIGMGSVKERRLKRALSSRPGLYVGNCVPFYFCPRSVMLYVIYKGNHPELTYRGGQDPIIHLESDLQRTVDWADSHGRRWAFTTGNAASYFTDDYANLQLLHKIDWAAVQATSWAGRQDGKQAECLMEHYFPWELVERIGVCSQRAYNAARCVVRASIHKPHLEVSREWYY
jgi:hypothetical protein